MKKPVFLFLLSLLLFPVCVRAQDAVDNAQEQQSTVKVIRLENGARLDFTLPEESDYKAYPNGQELLVVLDKSLGSIDVENLNTDIPDLLEYVSTGFDSFLVRATKGTVPSVGGSGRVVSVVLEQSVTEQIEPADEETVFVYRLGKARILSRNGQTIEARRILKELALDHPDSPEVILALAGVEEQLGRYARARGYYNRALALEPDNENLMASRQRMLKQTQPYVELDHYWRFVRNADRQMITRANVAMPRVGTAAFSAELVRTKVWHDEVRRKDGEISGFYGQRHFADFSMLWPTESLRSMTVHLYASDATAGAGLSVRQETENSTWQGMVDFHRPNGDFLEGLVDYATRHRAAIGYEKRFSDSWRMGTTGGYNIYSLGSQTNATHSLTMQASMGYDFRPAAGVLSVSYAIDGEYPLKTDRATDNQGVEYRVVPITTREVHSITGTWLVESAGDTLFAPYAGYTYDRYNRGGPTFGFRIDHELANRFDLGLYASRSIARITGAGAVTDRVGTTVRMRF